VLGIHPRKKRALFRVARYYWALVRANPNYRKSENLVRLRLSNLLILESRRKIAKEIEMHPKNPYKDGVPQEFLGSWFHKKKRLICRLLYFLSLETKIEDGNL